MRLADVQYITSDCFLIIVINLLLDMKWWSLLQELYPLPSIGSNALLRSHFHIQYLTYSHRSAPSASEKLAQKNVKMLKIRTKMPKFRPRIRKKRPFGQELEKIETSGIEPLISVTLGRAHDNLTKSAK